jgi:methylated-DNA-[protein]-cysteine S-methyltransferase
MLRLTARSGALTALDWAGAAAASGQPEAGDLVLAEAARQIAAYFAGRLKGFTLPLAPAGTPFQRRVWAALEEIRFGETVTYGDLARRLGTTPRPVGGACGRNPLPIVIPCHRVLGSDRDGGYSGKGGVATKDWLLGHEHATGRTPRLL